MRREFLQLAHTFHPQKHKIAGWFMSEKLDGTRCFWDGGLSRGVPTEHVPYASVIDPKTGKKKAKIKPVATGLWSRYGNRIMAPDWFLNQLPTCPLDGELFAGRGNFQLCRSIVAGDEPDERFNKVKYAVYGSPGIADLFLEGEIKNPNFHCQIKHGEILDFTLSRKDDVPDFEFSSAGSCTFAEELRFINWALEGEADNEYVYLHHQMQLPDDEQSARTVVDEYLKSVLDRGGEGVILRDPNATWLPKRNHSILKFKPYQDDEATIVGYVAGNEGKTEQLLGKIGALIVEWQGKAFELGTGMTHEEREFDDVQGMLITPGERVDPGNGKYLKRGQKVTFKYRELTDDGIPKEARFWRVRGCA